MDPFTYELEYAVKDDYQMALITAGFENEYNQVHAHTSQLLNTERDRAHCIEQLLLRIENESLQLQVHQTEKELIQARETESNTRLQLGSALRELDSLQGISQASLREIENLRHELALSNTVACDSQKLQAEKVRLSKEVSIIQSELEKFRSHNTSANTLLAEKQAATRQLNALEIQLEDEKRAHERTLAKQLQQTKEISGISSKLEEARQELELERRQNQDNTNQKRRATRSPQPPLAGRNGGTNKRFGIPKDRDQEDTPVPQQAAAWGSTTTKVPTERPSEAELQKLSSHLHPDLIIATPGAVRARDQQRKFSTLPGDKSSFSITPFLNRTTGLDESSTGSEDELNEVNSFVHVDKPFDSPRHNEHIANTMTALPKQKLADAKQPHNPRKQAPTKAALEGDTKKQMISDSPDGGYQAPLPRPVGQKQAVSKKRKLGVQRDRSLFDEDENDKMSETKKPGRKLVGTGYTGLAGNRVFAGPVGFSPLKRDRKRF